MNEINYPISTAAVFDDVIFPIHLDGPHQIKHELSLAVAWFCRWCNEEKMVVKSKMLVSFWGLYLSYQQSMDRAA